MARPRYSTSPDVARCNRRMVRPSVVLPQPDSPNNPSVSPAAISKDTPSTARTSAPLDGKCTLRLRTESSVSAISPHPAARPVVLARHIQGRMFPPAAINYFGAPLGEWALVRPERRYIRRLSGDLKQPPVAAASLGNAAQQRAGVRILWIPEQLRHWSRFHHPPGIHHQHAVGVLGDDPEVVRNQDQGGLAVAPPFAQ